MSISTDSPEVRRLYTEMRQLEKRVAVARLEI
jgi:hypothetical protein